MSAEKETSGAVGFLMGIACMFRMCPHVTKSDETGCWGECVRCGKRVGFVSSEDLRRYIDRTLPHQESANPSPPHAEALQGAYAPITKGE